MNKQGQEAFAKHFPHEVVTGIRIGEWLLERDGTLKRDGHEPSEFSGFDVLSSTEDGSVRIVVKGKDGRPVVSESLNETVKVEYRKHTALELEGELQQERDIRRDRENTITLVAEALGVLPEPHQTFIVNFSPALFVLVHSGGNVSGNERLVEAAYAAMCGQRGQGRADQVDVGNDINAGAGPAGGPVSESAS